MKKFKNLICSILLVIALLLGANLNLAIITKNKMMEYLAEYTPTDTVTPYEFDVNSGWSEYYNGTSSSDLYSAFTDFSKLRVDMYDMQSKENNLPFKPTTKYNGKSLVLAEGEERDKTIDDFALTLQANKAPKSIVTDQKYDDGTMKYVRDADGNFKYVSKLYTKADYDANPTLYVLAEDGENYYKKIEIGTNEDGSKKYKTDSSGALIYEAEVFDSNESNSDLYVQIENTGTYHKKIPIQSSTDSYFGYRSNSTISLKADSWYVVTFWIWTMNADASLVISSGTEFSAEMQVENTNGEWKQCRFFIENSSNSSNSVNITLFYGAKDGITKGKSGEEFVTSEAGVAVTSGAIFIDNLCFKTISETDYRNRTLGGETDENILVSSFTARYPYNDKLADLINNDFSLEKDVYDKMYGEDEYQENEAFAHDYQNFVSKYDDDAGTIERTENQLYGIRRAYNEYFTSSIVTESEDIVLDKKDKDGNIEKDENGENVKVSLNTFDLDNKVLKLSNNSEAYDLGLLSAKIPISQFGYYRLTIYLKGLTADNDATVKLISSIKTGAQTHDGVMQVKTQNSTPFTENSDITNNWTQMNFYIKASCYYDTYFQIALIANAKKTSEANVIYFDNIKLETISSSTYDSQASATTFDLSPSSTVISGKITNGYFNSLTSTKANPEEAEVPYTPASWTKLDDSSVDVKAGVVSTRDTLYSNINNKIGDANNPLAGLESEVAKENVLAIYSPRVVDENAHYGAGTLKEGHYYGLKSAQFSLSSNSVAKITFDVYADFNESKDSNFEGKIFANLIYASEHIAEFVENFAVDSVEKGKWITYTIYLRTGSDSRLCNLEIGVKDAFGTVFIKDVDYTTLSEKTDKEDKDKKISVDTQFDNLLGTYPNDRSQKDARIRFVSYGKNQFAMHSEEKVDGKYYTSLSHSLLEANSEDEPIIQGEMGIIDTTETLTLSSEEIYEPSVLKNPIFDKEDSTYKNNFAMLIYNKDNFNTTVYPNSNETLSANSYYKISVYVKTIGVKDGSGLTITMSNISARFDNINTQADTYGDLTETNGYKQFTVLVRTGSSSISGLRIGFLLGTEDNKTTGIALISGLDIEKLADEDAYNEEVEAVSEDDTSTIVKNFFIASEVEGDTDADNNTWALFFLVFSSILLVAVLVFAIVAFYIKKSPKRVKVATEDSAPKDGFV